MRIVFTMAVAAVLSIAAFTAQADHVELEKKDLKCQTAIGIETRRFVDLRHEAQVLCQNAGDGCNTERRDRAIARAGDRLATVLGRKCGGVDLGALHFPGKCDDADGAPFSVDNLVACITESQERGIDAILAVVGGSADRGHPRRCLRNIRRQAQTFTERKLRARTRCLDLQVKGKIAPFPEVDCRGDVPTGHRKTDRLINKATARLFDVLRRRCGQVDLEALGFPGACPAGAGTFALADLQDCVLTVSCEAVDDLIGAGFPAPTPTPTATGTPTPVPTPTGPV